MHREVEVVITVRSGMSMMVVNVGLSARLLRFHMSKSDPYYWLSKGPACVAIRQILFVDIFRRLSIINVALHDDTKFEYKNFTIEG